MHSAFRYPILASAVVELACCGGQSLQLGYDDDALAKDPAEPVDAAAASARCDAPPRPVEPTGSPADQVDRARALRAGRWLACPSNPSSYSAPVALELTDDGAFRLRETGPGIFVRGPLEPIEMSYSLAYESLEIGLGGVRYLVTFQRNPLRMTWSDRGAAYRFVRI